VNVGITSNARVVWLIQCIRVKADDRRKSRRSQLVWSLYTLALGSLSPYAKLLLFTSPISVVLRVNSIPRVTAIPTLATFSL